MSDKSFFMFLAVASIMKSQIKMFTGMYICKGEKLSCTEMIPNFFEYLSPAIYLYYYAAFKEVVG